MSRKRKNGPKSKQAGGRRAPAAARTRPVHVWLVALGLAVGTSAVYGQVLDFQFVGWDDTKYVYENPHIAEGLTMQSVGWAFTPGYASNWHPVTWISHIMDVQLFGLQRGQDASVFQGPGGHHLVSVVLHVGNSMLLLLLLYRMTGAFWPSALTAALFAVHPLRVESVAWVSERKDVLSGLFFMLTLLAYRWYAQRPTLRRYWLVFIALAVGLMAKPMLVTVPFLLLLLDYWPLRRLNLGTWDLDYEANPQSEIRNPKFVWLLLEKLPLLGLVVASSLVTMFAQQTGGAVASLEGIPWSWRLVNTPVAYGMYLLKTVWPTNLACFYPHPAVIPTERLGDWILSAVGATLFLVLVTVVVLLMARSRPYLVVGWLWFLGMLVPVIGLMQVGSQAWADRYAYLPMVGVYLMFSWSLAQLVQHRPAVRQAVIGVAGAVLLVMLPLTWWQVGVWRNSQSLYGHTLAVTRNNYLAHYNWGCYARAELGDHEEAIEHFKDALRIKPDLDEAHNNWGGVLAELERLPEAVEHFQQALEINPDNADAHYNMGAALQEAEGRIEQEIGHYQEALRINPDYADAHHNWGAALAEVGRPQEAIAHYREALRIKPNHAQAHYNLGRALKEIGNPKEAVTHFEQALQIKPDFAEAHNNLGNALQALGRFQEAIKHYQEALQIEPDLAQAHDNWGNALKAMGRFEQAVAHYQQALRIKPDYVEAHNNWAAALRNAGHPEKAIEHYQEALRVKPDYAEAHNNWGNALQELKRFEEAIAHFQEALRIKPDLTEAQNNWGNVVKDLGRFEEAIAHYKEALRIKPDFAEAHNNLAWLLATCPEDPIRDGEQALDHAERAVELVGDDNAAILDSLSAAYAQLGDFQQAVRWQQKAVQKAGKEIKDDLAARSKLYEQGEPFRESH